MAGFKISETIDAPRQEVFDFATSLDHVAEWLPNVVSVEPITEGDLRPGYRFKETRVQGKRESSAEIEIVEHQAPEVHAAQAKVGKITATYTYTFHETGDGRTRVDCEADVQGAGVVKIFTGLLAMVMKKADGNMLVSLKAAIENGGAQKAA